MSQKIEINCPKGRFVATS